MAEKRRRRSFLPDGRSTGKRCARNAEGLTELQARFVEEYMVDGNISQAAKRAGSSCKSLGDASVFLMRNPKVLAAIDARREKYREKLQITQEKVLNEIAAMAFYDAGAIAIHEVCCADDIVKLPQNLRAAVVGWSYDKHGNFVLKFADKGRALDQLARHLALYNDSLKVTVTDKLAERLARAKERVA